MFNSMKPLEKIGLSTMVAANVMLGLSKDVIDAKESTYAAYTATLQQNSPIVDHPSVLTGKETADPEALFEARKELLKIFLLEKDNKWQDVIYNKLGEDPETEKAYYTLTYIRSEYTLFSLAVLSMQEDLAALERIRQNMERIEEAERKLEKEVGNAKTDKEKKRIFMQSFIAIIRIVYNPDIAAEVFKNKYRVLIDHTTYDTVNQCLPLEHAKFFQEVPRTLLRLETEHVSPDLFRKFGIKRINFTEECTEKGLNSPSLGWVDPTKPDLIEISGNDFLFHELKHGFDFQKMTEPEWDQWFTIASKAQDDADPYSYDYNKPPAYLNEVSCSEHYEGLTDCNSYALTNELEDSAVFFENSMNNFYEVQRIAQKDAVVEEKLAYQNSFLEKVVPAFNKIYWTKKHQRDKLKSRISQTLDARTPSLLEEDYAPARAVLREVIETRQHLLGKNEYYYRIFHDSLEDLRHLALLSDIPQERQGLMDGLGFFTAAANKLRGRAAYTEYYNATLTRMYLDLIEKRRKARK